MGELLYWSWVLCGDCFLGVEKGVVEGVPAGVEVHSGAEITEVGLAALRLLRDWNISLLTGIRMLPELEAMGGVERMLLREMVGWRGDLLEYLVESRRVELDWSCRGVEFVSQGVVSERRGRVDGVERNEVELRREELGRRGVELESRGDELERMGVGRAMGEELERMELMVR